MQERIVKAGGAAHQPVPGKVSYGGHPGDAIRTGSVSALSVSDFGPELLFMNKTVQGSEFKL